jgi:enoyl-CoA hydratase
VSVQYRSDGHIAVVTIARPDARNAVNGEVARGIEAAIDRIEGDANIWVGILTGMPPAFSAGADLKAINAGHFADLSTERGGFGGITRRERTKPMIAAVDGPALAGGCEIVLCCDLVVASTAASFGIPEVKRSLIAAGGGLLRLPRRVPLNIAMEAALTGEPLSAARAARFGMVNELCEPGEALESAIALAKRVTANAPVAVRESRRVLLASTLLDEEAGWEMTERALARTVRSPDFRDGLRAFLEKRPPSWVGE